MVLRGNLCYYDTVMQNRSSKTKGKQGPEDLNEAAFRVVSAATSDAAEKNPAAVELGRKGGLKGGKARALKLTPEQRSEIAQIAARARWKKTTD